MDLQVYLPEQRAQLTAEFEAMKRLNDQAKQQIASLESSIKTRNEQMAQLQGAFSQLRHLEAAMNKQPEVVGTDTPLLAAVPKRRRKSAVVEQANG